MITWLKNLFSSKSTEVAPVVEVTPVVEAVVAKAPAKKSVKKTTKKKVEIDLDSMSKKDLLAHAKANGIKSNASMNKGAILKAIKNG